MSDFRWQDQIWEYPRRYRLQQNADGSIEINPEKGKSIQDGTPVNAHNLNGMMDDITDAINECVKISSLSEMIGNRTKGEIQYVDVVPAEGSLMKRIPIGDNHYAGFAVIIPDSGNNGLLVWFGRNSSDTISYGGKNMPSASERPVSRPYKKSISGALSEPSRYGIGGVAGANDIIVDDFYIDNTDIVIVFKHILRGDDTDERYRTVNCHVAWEVL